MANLIQLQYRGRNDDGSETAATWKKISGAPWYQAANSTFRLRLEIEESNNSPSSSQFDLQYNLNGNGWNTVTGSSSVVRMTTSSHVSSGTATTNQIPDSATAFVAGQIVTSASANHRTSSISLQNQHTEVEYVLTLVEADVSPGDTIQFRTTNAGTPLNQYLRVAEITVGGPLIRSLVSYWKLDEASGTRDDSHSFNHLSSVNSVGSAAGKIGNAAEFVAASSQYLNIVDNASLSITGDMTWAGWVWLDSLTNFRIIASKWTPPGDQRSWMLSWEPSVGFEAFLFSVSSTGSGLTNVAASTFGIPNTGQWYFVACRHDASANQISISVNDGAWDTASHSGGIFDSTAPFRIATNGNTVGLLDGRVDEVGIWNRVLSDAEVAELYNGGDGRTYPFEAATFDLNSETGSYSVSGQEARLLVEHALSADAGEYAVTGQDAGLLASRQVAADAGAYSVTGQEAGLELVRVLDAEAGTYSLSGAEAGLESTRVLAADPGEYAIAGAEATLIADRAVDAGAGEYALSGEDAALLAGRVLDAELGEYAVTGSEAGLLSERVLDAEAGEYVVTGADATLETTGVFEINAEPGEYTVAGADAGLARVLPLNAEPGEYAVTGTDATLLAVRSLSADAGEYAITGSDAAVLASRTVDAEVGSYATTGVVVELKVSRTLLAEAGGYLLSGLAAVLETDAEPPVVPVIVCFTDESFATGGFALESAAAPTVSLESSAVPVFADESVESC